jgi:hypothetical protein
MATLRRPTHDPRAPSSEHLFTYEVLSHGVLHQSTFARSARHNPERMRAFTKERAYTPCGLMRLAVWGFPGVVAPSGAIAYSADEAIKPCTPAETRAAISGVEYHELNDEQMAEARAEALARILGDGSDRKLVVAGPGTGKTFTFQQLLAQSPGPNLALTFLNGLAAELEKAFGDLAEVYSFHGFAKKLLHTLPVDGVTNAVDYYPAFDLIGAQDVSILGVQATRQRIQEVVMNLLDGEPDLAALMRAGEYYDVVGYDDSVYRVLRHFQTQPGDIPKDAQIVVDEYQDFNRMEIELIEAMAHVNPTLVAGDDDQALYTFRHASAIFLRDLVGDNRYANFELPFCSRCPDVIVSATHRIVDKAQERGLLTDRIPKDYVCYLPDKRAASDSYPTITHAQCSVERNNAPYIEHYLEEQIEAIPVEDIQRSRAAGHPTVLVIGPKQFSQRAYQYLAERFGEVTFKMSSQHDVRLIDGYKRLMDNRDSRLGWRILLEVLRPLGWQEMVREALTKGAGLGDLISDDFRAAHGHFRTSNQHPSEAEVCELLVALTRARQKCTLVSVRNFGGEWLDDSVFIEWLEPLLDPVTVDKAYFSPAQG